jgi:hypothetical protein
MFADLDDFTALGGAGFDMSRSGSHSSNMDTVSPVELLMSAPGSTAFTNLTSPSIYTPELDSYDVSPSFDTHDFDANPDNWPSLFPDSGDAAPAYTVDQSPSLGADLQLSGTGQQPRKSSSTSLKGNRHSLSAGVNARKRDKPLPPIVVEDPQDTVAVKRARNTLAARKSRERKAQKMEEYEEEIERLKAERDFWKGEAISRGASDTAF